MRQVSNSASFYEKDFYKWAKTQVSLLKKRDFSKLDLEHVIEEIESLGRSDKRALRNYLIVLIQHLLKNTYASEQNGNSKSWDATILNSRKEIKFLLKDSPSLKNEMTKIFDDVYESAREMAILETNLPDTKFPRSSPWPLSEIMGQ